MVRLFILVFVILRIRYVPITLFTVGCVCYWILCCLNLMFFTISVHGDLCHPRVAHYMDSFPIWAHAEPWILHYIFQHWSLAKVRGHYFFFKGLTFYWHKLWYVELSTQYLLLQFPKMVSKIAQPPTPSCTKVTFKLHMSTMGLS